MWRVLSFFWVIICISSCSAYKVQLGSGDKSISRILRDSKLQSHDYGFALYDPATTSWIAQRQSARYFTPASNTKILTLCTALHYLGDSTIAARYVVEGDTLVFWGTGDPSFQYDDFENDALVRLIKDFAGSVVLYAPKDQVTRYGPGWAWDDFNYAFQVERSTLPVSGNRLHVERVGNDLVYTPVYFEQFVVEDLAQERGFDRVEGVNAFSIDPRAARRTDFERAVPFVPTDYDIAQILSRLAGREIGISHRFKHPDESNTLAGSPTDSLYRQLMQDSDNFIAEQLLFQAADIRLGEISDDIIDTAQLEVFAGLPDSLVWFDGSGLSRYNMCTPRTLVTILDRLLTQKGIDYVREIFPAGGVSGTIEQWYAGDAGPFIFAKTGTLMGKHCLSGYLVTESGRTLIFSFMNGNYLGPSANVKKEMDRILRVVHDKY